MGDFVRYILFEQTDETRMHRVDPSKCVYDADPRIYNDAGCMKHVRVMDDRILVQDASAPTDPWVRFQVVPPEFSWTDWSAATDYAIGDLCYVSSTGHTYKALQASTNKNPVSETTYWEEVGFPHFMLTYIKHAVAGDMIQEDDGRYREQGKAEKELERLIEVRTSAYSPRKAVFR